MEDNMKFNITIHCDEAGAWIAECPAIPGCVSQGRTKDEAIANIREAIQLCLEVRSEQGMPLTIETRRMRWSDVSLATAMRGMEDEDGPVYTAADLKVVF
jgi:predicted RNase H-like HicB family nuclease